jgi:NAD-dependent DNA ligase
LQQLVKKIGKEIKGGTGVKSLLSKRKRKIDNVFLLMLMSVPSISERIATVLVEHWPTLKDLQAQLMEDAEQLRTLQVTEKRKIGPAVIKSLKQYLC